VWHISIRSRKTSSWRVELLVGLVAELLEQPSDLAPLLPAADEVDVRVDPPERLPAGARAAQGDADAAGDSQRKAGSCCRYGDPGRFGDDVGERSHARTLVPDLRLRRTR
jgi:hypothetical protein